MFELALFAGAGGGMLGGNLLGWKPIGAVECDRHCREDLLRRQRDGMFPLFPIWDDVRTFRADNPETGTYIETVCEMAPVIVTAGFPCQPYSQAGKGKGEGDERNLWPDTIRIIREVGPEIAFLENVPGLLCFDYFGEILGDLAEAGYDAEWGIVSAAECGALHKRKRLWILAYSRSIRCNTGRAKQSLRRIGKYCKARKKVANTLRVKCEPRTGGRGVRQGDQAMANTTGPVCEGERAKQSRMQSRLANTSWWATEPDVGRVAHGVAFRMDRLKAIGNGQVPIVAAVAFCRLASIAGLDLKGYAPALFGDIKKDK